MLALDESPGELVRACLRCRCPPLEDDGGSDEDGGALELLFDHWNLPPPGGGRGGGACLGAHGVGSVQVGALQLGDRDGVGDHHDRGHDGGVIDLEGREEEACPSGVVQALVHRRPLLALHGVGQDRGEESGAVGAGVATGDCDEGPSLVVCGGELDVVPGVRALRVDPRLPVRVRPQPNRQVVLGRRQFAKKLHVRVEVA
mmetsp:Transcript_7566/g.17803  ORF Transcript_7566/g.17803 Transcript_7566/m.17803 type:complete len:201 (+) Transcript_7566:738-1340(+)